MPTLPPVAPVQIGLHSVRDTLSLKQFLDKIAKDSRFVSGGWIGHVARKSDIVKRMSIAIGDNTGQVFSSITEASLTAFCRSTVKRQLRLATATIANSSCDVAVNALFSNTRLNSVKEIAPLVSWFLSDLAQSSLESTINDLTESLVAVLKPILCEPIAKSVGNGLSSWLASSAEVYIGNKIQQHILYFLALNFNSVQANGLSDFLSAASEINGIDVIAQILLMMLVYHLLVYLYERYVLENQMDKAVNRLSEYLIEKYPNTTNIPDQAYQLAILSAVSIVLRGARIKPDYVTTLFDVKDLKDLVMSPETAPQKSR